MYIIEKCKGGGLKKIKKCRGGKIKNLPPPPPPSGTFSGGTALNLNIAELALSAKIKKYTEVFFSFFLFDRNNMTASMEPITFNDLLLWGYFSSNICLGLLLQQLKRQAKHVVTGIYKLVSTME